MDENTQAKFDEKLKSLLAIAKKKKNVLEYQEEKNDWWLAWGSGSGSTDCSKTQRLGDYIGAIQEHTGQKEFCLLHGTIYLYVA